MSRVSDISGTPRLALLCGILLAVMIGFIVCVMSFRVFARRGDVATVDGLNIAAVEKEIKLTQNKIPTPP